MKNKFLSMLFLAVQVFALVSCEKAYMGNEKEQTVTDAVSVRFNVTNFEQIPFSGISRASVSGICTRIDMAVFNETGKVKTLKQEKDKESDFGTLKLSLSKGTYQVVIIAHSGAGAATISSPEEISFKDNKVTDTFYYYGEVTISDDAKNFDVSLKRAVAMFRFVVSDNIPANVAQMEFYYTGGSSTLNAKTGFGAKNSRQTEIRDVSAAAHNSSSVYEVYSFPHEASDVLKITVSAFDALGATVAERVFENVPITVNKITQYTGEFFGELQSAQGNSFTLVMNDEWLLEEYNY